MSDARPEGWMGEPASEPGATMPLGRVSRDISLSPVLLHFALVRRRFLVLPLLWLG